MLDSSGVSSLVPWMTATWFPPEVSPIFLASLMTNWITFSVPWKVGILNPIHPLVVFICLTTEALIEQARIFTYGLYFDTNLASLPESVKTMIKPIGRSKAAEQQDEATASAVWIGDGVKNLVS